MLSKVSSVITYFAYVTCLYSNKTGHELTRQKKVMTNKRQIKSSVWVLSSVREEILLPHYNSQSGKEGM